MQFHDAGEMEQSLLKKETSTSQGGLDISSTSSPFDSFVVRRKMTWELHSAKVDLHGFLNASLVHLRRVINLIRVCIVCPGC